MDQTKIGAFIAEMRKSQNLTQREFADRLGISNKTVSKWETGNGMPELSLMLPVCDILKINLNELFSGEKLNDAHYRIKAEENIMRLIEETEKMRKNIVGGDILGQTCDIKMDVCETHETNAAFWNTIGSTLLGAAILPEWGAYLPSEEKLHLLGDLRHKKVLEIGCGDGRSLEYAAKLGAAELWGLDIAENQIGRADTFLKSNGIQAKLVCAAMEDECGLPTDYFDLVYSVYGIGWTTDLDKTFSRIHSYLKSGGRFIFGWSHPIHKCVSFENGELIFSNSYFNEAWYCAAMGSKEIMLSNRMLSTYINALANNGFTIETLIEETDKEKAMTSNHIFGRKAQMLPTAFVIRSRKA